MKRLRKLIIYTLVVFIATTVSACAEMYKKPCKEPCTTSNEKFVYSIQFNAKTGELEVLNKNNERVKPKPVNFPEEHLPVEAIVNVHTIIEAKGSCLVIVNGRVYNVCLF
ncbi:MAG: hypothetical protein ABW077_05580 [Candidatus Thiodiazotropha endolucinida]